MSEGGRGRRCCRCFLCRGAHSAIRVSLCSWGLENHNVNTHNSVQNCFPALRSIFSDCAEEKLLILWNRHLFVHEQLVGGLVVGREWEGFGECWIHGVDINIDCEIFGSAFVTEMEYNLRLIGDHKGEDLRCVSSFSSQLIVSTLPILKCCV